MVGNGGGRGSGGDDGRGRDDGSGSGGLNYWDGYMHFEVGNRYGG